MAHEVAIDHASAFILSSGSAAELARLRFLLYGERAPAACVDALFADQRADGGFVPFWARDYSSVDATCYRLSHAVQLGVTGDVRMRHALHFLAARQASDGSMSEDTAVTDVAPPWAQPADDAAQLYLTANAGFWLALFDPLPDAANAAGRFLHNQLQKGSALAASLQANWLAAALWHVLGWQKPYAYADAYLLRELPGIAASPDALGWLISALRSAAVPAVTPVLVQACAHLLALQQPDGRWASEEDPARDLPVTLTALQALLQMRDAVT
jgi:hypothetical protein